MMDQLSGDSERRADPDHFNPKDWLEFDETYLAEEFRINKLYHDQLYSKVHNKQFRFRTWGLGAIYLSLTFPEALAGAATRRPGRIRPTVNDHEVMNRLMQNTNETIHASVRARIDLGGPSYETDPEVTFLNRILFGIYTAIFYVVSRFTRRKGHDVYIAHERGPLRGWVLRDGHKYHDEVAVNEVDLDRETEHLPPYWEWQGDDALVEKGKRLQEDRMGTHELSLLSHYPDVAELIERTNLGLSRTDEFKHHAGRKHSSVRAYTLPPNL